MRRLVIPAVAVGALLAAAPTASAVDCYAPGAPVCVRAAVQGPLSSAGSFKPKRISTIEYTVPIIKITWSSWTRQKAVGRGFPLRCGKCDIFDPGPAVAITLTHPIEYFCGPSAAEEMSIGTWFSRATIKGRVMNVGRKIIDGGHPNAC
jgi:hypothetical protein